MFEFPFTMKELLLAFSLVFPPAQAQELAEGIHDRSANGDVNGWAITSETLMLLSIASPDLEEKVDAFIRDYWPQLDVSDWRRQRDELRHAIKTGKVRPG